MPVIQLADGVARNHLVRLDGVVNVCLQAGEHLAILGPNGAGKSLLVDMLTGKSPLKEGTLTYDFSPSPSLMAYDNLRYIAFRDTYGAADASYYYQQRWNADEHDTVPLVKDLLDGAADSDASRQLLRFFDIGHLLEKQIILLSSGELRKVQLIKALLATPRVLVIDNPFIGLDTDARALLRTLLAELSSLEHLQLILVIANPADVPDFITHIIPVLDKRVGAKISRKAYLEENSTIEVEKPEYRVAQLLSALPLRVEDFSAADVIRMRQVGIRYGDRVILHGLDWTVCRGEKWALCGANGSGKSTLLSLVCADNPQSYACDIYLFGRKRGTGESIWDIKKRIGYVSPEMHRGYQTNIPAIEIVASGLHDSIGLYRRPQPGQFRICTWWMEVFGIASLKDRPFLQLSSGEQRLVLLARAFVKDPELLILDEPLHGLDVANRSLVKRVIGLFCARPGKTLVMVTHYEEDLPDCINKRIRLIPFYKDIP